MITAEEKPEQPERFHARSRESARTCRGMPQARRKSPAMGSDGQLWHSRLHELPAGGTSDGILHRSPFPLPIAH
jgi:hypothetical protein